MCGDLVKELSPANRNQYMISSTWQNVIDVSAQDTSVLLQSDTEIWKCAILDLAQKQCRELSRYISCFNVIWKRKNFKIEGWAIIVKVSQFSIYVEWMYDASSFGFVCHLVEQHYFCKIISQSGGQQTAWF